MRARCFVTVPKPLPGESPPTCRWLGRMAMQTSSNVAVTFDTTNNKYTLAGIQSLDRLSSNCTVNLAIDPYQATLTTVPFVSNKVTFSTYGSADQGGTITVTSGGFSWTVTLEATSGKVTVSGP